MLKTFLTLVGASVVISFHESLWAWALVPMGVALLMVLVGLQLERREVERGGR
jgi:predicted Na+-dependent transporter